MSVPCGSRDKREVGDSPASLGGVPEETLSKQANMTPSQHLRSDQKDEQVLEEEPPRGKSRGGKFWRLERTDAPGNVLCVGGG